MKKGKFVLPEDVMIDIFLRSPVQTLARLRCVCRSWNNLITSQSFVGFHLKKSTSNTRLLFFRYGLRPSTLGFYSSKCRNFLDLCDPSFPIELVDLEMLGSCNGMLCFCTSGLDRSLIYMWNPSVRKYITLPKPSYNPRYLGFGVNSSSDRLDDFKVVAIFANANAEVYSLRTNSWRRVADGFPPSVEINGNPINHPVFVEGSVHWCARVSCYVNAKCPWLIVSFDFAKEVFHKIMLPDEMSIDDGTKYLNVLDGSLCVFATVRKVYCTYELWVMKEYGVVESWTRLHIIEKAENFWWPLGFTKNGKIYVRGVCEHSRNTLLTYDPIKKKFKCSGIHLCGFALQILTFVESLISPLPRSANL